MIREGSDPTLKNEQPDTSTKTRDSDDTMNGIKNKLLEGGEELMKAQAVHQAARDTFASLDNKMTSLVDQNRIAEARDIFESQKYVQAQVVLHEAELHLKEAERKLRVSSRERMPGGSTSEEEPNVPENVRQLAEYWGISPEADGNVFYQNLINETVGQYRVGGSVRDVLPHGWERALAFKGIGPDKIEKVLTLYKKSNE